MTSQAQVVRKKMIGAVHAAASAAGLDSDTRKDMQKRITGKDSCAKMSVGELGAVLDEINQKKPQKKPMSPVQRKIKALWISLYYLTVIDERSDKAIDAFVKRQTGIEKLAWLPPDRAWKVIEALKSMAARDGKVDWNAWAGPDKDERVFVIMAIWRQLRDLGEVDADDVFGPQGYARRLGINLNYPQFKPHHYDLMIRRLGEWLRNAKAEQ